MLTFLFLFVCVIGQINGQKTIDVDFGISKVSACIGKTSLRIRWRGNYDLVETSTPDCAINASDLNATVKEPIQIVNYTAVRTDLGAWTGDTRYFRASHFCEIANLEVSCPPAAIPQSNYIVNVSKSDLTVQTLVTIGALIIFVGIICAAICCERPKAIR